MDTGALVTIAGLGATLVAMVAAVVVITPSRRSSRPAVVATNVATFKQRSRTLRDHQTSLNIKVLDISPPSWRASGVPLLTRAGWIFDQPVPLDDVHICLNSEQRPRQALSKRELLYGLDLSGGISYSQAVTELAGMSHFTNGIIYRPIKAEFTNTVTQIDFEIGNYFDYLDTGEIFGYKRSCSVSSRSLRKDGDPFEFESRTASLGILTLTIYETGGVARFLIHKRAASVVVAPGLFHVVPAGEFAPSDISLAAIERDFSLRRNIEREFAEELLGDIDAQGSGGKFLDYDNEPPYRELGAAVSAGELKYYALGLGLDPLTWKPELLTVAVFRHGSFDRIFGGGIVGNFEGTVITGSQFDCNQVDNYLNSANTRLGTKACLQLAWKHRGTLLS
ncbi:hypothetical protein [Nocardia rhizosphaerihabitans]|uniref:Uncharacterized protein n=1 Tax=Nocardia rhizosphaerihabitans TaxID=1691570 RepID=A0ABQ2KCZ8_9NOCA|nr:hypothetical protein [Nocardia rhizosphaerihabitans]GGN78511.1 hypothetical protein GCM10011610_26110 [Nocardia rhizosphaerihabitans]